MDCDVYCVKLGNKKVSIKIKNKNPLRKLKRGRKPATSQSDNRGSLVSPSIILTEGQRAETNCERVSNEAGLSISFRVQELWTQILLNPIPCCIQSVSRYSPSSQYFHRIVFIFNPSNYCAQPIIFRITCRGETRGDRLFKGDMIRGNDGWILMKSDTPDRYSMFGAR